MYELLRDEATLETGPIDEIKLAERFATYYEQVRIYPHGPEVADSFAVIDYALRAQSLTEIAELKNLTDFQNLSGLERETLLRPTVIEALKALGDISAEVALALSDQATLVGQQAAALNRAAGLLNDLVSYIEREVLPPERVLLTRVVRHWQSLLAEEQGRLGQEALQAMSPVIRRTVGVAEWKARIGQRPALPFDNPYIAGNPVYPPLLVGRQDIFNRIDVIWSTKTNPDSIILYGHRRMGKSSILRNLDQVARPSSLIVYADMAGETSFVESTTDLLLNLADQLYMVAHRTYPEASLVKPDINTYNSPARAQREFSRLADQVRDVLQGQTIIFALDEFEAIERAVTKGQVDQEIYQFLRAKTQEPQLTLLFGGLHTLDEMSRDYQQPFYGSYTNIRVSYLSPEAAWQLVTNPVETFQLNYEREAVEWIIAVTGGQPYLLQQLCRDALDHLNHELFDLRRERELVIGLADVEAALGNDFFRRGMVYFDGVWSQASQPEQQRLLQVAAQRDEPWTLAELARASGLQEEGLSRLLRWAERQDILARTEGAEPVWDFYVPLMREWLRRRG
jgi:hypothetical protein